MKSYNFEVMKRRIIILALAIFAIFPARSQDNANRERLNAYKIGFFTKRLNLTSSEAEKFWPIYNDFQAQRAKIQLEKQQLIRSFNQGEGSLNNSQLAEIGDRLIGTVVKESELAVSFHAKLKEVLPPAKVIRFYQAENQFRLLLLNELQNRQQNRERQEPADLPDL